MDVAVPDMLPVAVPSWPCWARSHANRHV